MNATHPDRVAFHLSGQRGGGLAPAAGLRPALQAGFRDLAALRHDFPLVLLDGDDGLPAASLRSLVDDALERLARGADAERTRRQVLRVEQEVRALVQGGSQGSLGEMWGQAVQRLASGRDAAFAETARRALAALPAGGRVLGCDASLTGRLLRHVWRRAQQRKEAALRERLVRLIQQLSDILRSDFERSDAGRSAARLEASLGGRHHPLFDCEALSGLLARAVPHVPMPQARRERIRKLLAVLDTQPFVALPDVEAARAAGHVVYGYEFERCEAALAAWNERWPQLVALARAIEMAGMEIDGRYEPARHDAVFASYGANGLDARELDRFPDYFVDVEAGALDAPEQARMMEILAGELPIKLLVRMDDLAQSGLRGRQIAHMAMGLNQVYVVQSAASLLARFAPRLDDGMRFAGPALFGVFTGVRGGPDGQSPYLTAAAATESRAFPAFVYDPSGGPDWASRFSIEGNPQPERDWPVHRFEFEDARHQRVTEELAFTAADFLAADPRQAAHLAALPGAPQDDDLATVSDMLRDERRGVPEKVPYVRMIDGSDRLHTVVVDERIVREARRVGDLWRSLQELGGVHNSHAKRLLEKERSAWEAERAAQAVPAAGPAQAQAAASGLAAEPAAAEPAPEPAHSRDEAYIETARCSTCNECTQVNPKMFAYDANRQAYIADLKAGTYAQLVEAAESCQVSVIHPGKPLNPNEPGLEELLARAEPFR